MVLQLQPSKYGRLQINLMNKVPRVDGWTTPKGDDVITPFQVQLDKFYKGMRFDFRRLVSADTMEQLMKNNPSENDVGFTSFIITRQAYKNSMETYMKYINFFIKYFDHDNEYLAGAIKLKYCIDMPDTPYSIERFSKDCLSVLLTSSMREKVRDMVDHQVELNNVIIEEGDKTYGQSTESVGFTDDHYRQVMTVSTFMKLLIPIIGHYYYMHQDDIIEYVRRKQIGGKFGEPQVYRIIFEELYTHICDFEAITKIYDTAQIYVKNADQCMRERAHRRGVTDVIKKDETITQHLTEIAPKYGFHLNPFKMNHSSIRDSMRREFESKEDSIIYTPVHSSSNSDEPSGLEMLESAHANMTDLDFAMNEANIQLTMDRLCKQYDVEFNTDELEFYRDKLRNTKFINKIQEFFVSHFGGVYDLMSMRQKEAAKLVVLFKVIMKRMGFIYLQHLLTGSVSKNGKLSLRKISKTRLNKLMTDDKYIRLINQYSHTIDPEDNHIIELISQLTNTPIVMVDYDNPRNGDLIVSIDGDARDIVQDECLRFELML